MEPASATPLPLVPADPSRGRPEVAGAGAKGAFVTSVGRGDPAADPIARARLDLTQPVRLPPEGRLSASTLAILAAAAGVVAILLGGWAFFSGMVDTDDPDSPTTSTPDGYGDAVALLSAPNVERLRLRGSVGRLVLAVRPSGDAALVVNGLGEAERGWAYQAWVSTPGAITPRSAGLFSGREAVVPLTTQVPPGATLAVTLEPEVGSFAPTRTPKLFVQRPA